MWEALPKRVGERKAFPFKTMTIQFDYWLSWRLHKPGTSQAPEGSPAGFGRSTAAEGGPRETTPGASRGSMGEAKTGHPDPEDPLTLTHQRFDQRAVRSPENGSLDFVSHITWLMTF